MYYSIEQAAELLHKSKRQLQYLVQQGYIKPVNPDTYRRDGGYRFTEEQLKLAKEQYEPEGYSVNEVANMLGITSSYLMQLVQKENIETLIVYKGKQKRRFFTEEQFRKCENIVKQLSQKNRQGEYGWKVQLISREVHIFSEGAWKGSMARVIGTNPMKVLLESGEIIQPNEWKGTSTSVPDQPYIRRRGFAEFQFPIPRHPNHPVFNLLHNLVRQLGARNITIYEQLYGDYYVRCRLGTVSLTEEEASLMQRHLIKGDWQKEENGIRLESGEIQHTVYLPKSLQEQLSNTAKQQDVSSDYLITKALRAYLDN